jgi:hypothetical protein
VLYAPIIESLSIKVLYSAFNSQDTKVWDMVEYNENKYCNKKDERHVLTRILKKKK